MNLWKKIGIGVLVIVFLLVAIGILVPSPETETSKITGKAIGSSQLTETKETSIEEFGKFKTIKLPDDTGNSDIYGDKVVFEGSSSGNNDIFLYDIPSGKTTQITFDNSDQNHPRIYGNNIIWSDNRFEYGEIFSYNIISGKEKKLEIKTIKPAPEAVGFYNEILVLRGHDENGRYVWYVYNLTSKETTRLYLDPDPTDTIGISVSQIYDYKLIGTYGDDILVYNIPDNSTQIIESSLAQSSPFMYENTIVWSDNRNGKMNNDIYAYDFSTGEETHVTTQQDTVEIKPMIYKNFVFYQKFRWDSDGYAVNEQLIIHDLSTGKEKVLSTPCTVMDKIYENKMLCRALENDSFVTYILVFE
ncbi:MAG: hypothetical protein HYW23_04175 [Candidatus Aenigmarchaeota archaeon]|nr:hypothetical protein [Candidatus Aenigmarchaeota archaeon]